MKTLKSQTNPIYLIAADIHHINSDGSQGHFAYQEFWSETDWQRDHFKATRFETED